MKKFLKVSSIILTILNVFLIAAGLLCIFKPEEIGAGIVALYEEITSDLGHTVSRMYNVLSLGTAITMCVSLLLTSIVAVSGCFSCKCGEEVSEEPVIEIPTVEGEQPALKKKTLFWFGKKTKEQIEEKISEEIKKELKRKEKKTKKEPVKEEPVAAAPESAANPAVSKANKINSFVDSLRNKR